MNKKTLQQEFPLNPRSHEHERSSHQEIQMCMQTFPKYGHTLQKGHTWRRPTDVCARDCWKRVPWG